MSAGNSIQSSKLAPVITVAWLPGRALVTPQWYPAVTGCGDGACAHTAGIGMRCVDHRVHAGVDDVFAQPAKLGKAAADHAAIKLRLAHQSGDAVNDVDTALL